MHAQFWHDRWSRNEIGFHEADGNALLNAHFGALGLAPGSRVFVPLCGKTRDIGWLLTQDCRVIGAELSRIAVEQLFDDLKLTPEITELDDLTLFSARRLKVYVGDIFALSRDILSGVDAIYDRAALVALPTDVRTAYAAHLHRISGGAPILQLSFEYDQTQCDGPPFSIDKAELQRLYADLYDIAELARTDVPGGLKGRCPAEEAVWHLSGGR